MKTKLFSHLLFVSVFLFTCFFYTGLVSAQSNACNTDINQDKVVDLSDYSVLAANLLKSSNQITNQRADINRDGVVDLSDYSLLAANLLKPLVGCVTPTPTPNPPSPTPTPQPTPQPTPTPTPQPTPYPTPNPSIPPVSSNEWTQHAFNAQHTSYSPSEIPTPWRWKWSWNGPNASGGEASGKTSLPRNVQPVTGGGRVYVAAGSRGVYALDKTDKNNDRQADVLWNATQVGTVNSTVAYDQSTQAIFALSTQGTLYKLSASNGSTMGTVSLGGSSTLPLPPTIYGDRIHVGMGSNAYAINKNNLSVIWTYQTGSTIQTPLAFSPAFGKAVVGTADLFVHAINDQNGTRSWRVKPSIVSAGSPNEFTYGWPVISEANGLVLMKMRLNWETLFFWTPWPTTNNAIRNNLTSNPEQQALFALNLSNGDIPFITNVGHGGYGDGGYMPMGPQPVIKKHADGNESAFTVIRGDNRYDGRWDSHFGEVVLNNNTISGLSAGSVRWIQYGNFGWSNAGNNDTPPTDEQANVSMAGDQYFGGHWALGNAFRITDRSAAYGTYTNPIRTTALPHIVSSTNVVPFGSSHFSSSGIAMTAGGTEWRAVPYGFYIYNDSVGKIYDKYWTTYAVWVPSGDSLYFRSNDGAIVALESGNPTADAGFSLTRMASNSVTKISDWWGGINKQVVKNWSPLAIADSQITYDQAANFSGTKKTITGQVEYIFNNGKSVLLGFKYPHQDHFKVQIDKDIWNQFGDNFGSLIGRNNELFIKEGDTITVTGVINWYQGDPTMYLESVMDLEVAR